MPIAAIRNRAVRPTRTRPLEFLLLSGLLAILAIACGRSSSAPKSVAGSDVASTIESLRFAVASRPSDMNARRQLARLELSAGRLGAARRHFDVVREYGDLTALDRQALADLYARRFVARLAHGDFLAHEDAATARALGLPDRDPRLADTSLAEAALLAALVEFRRATQWARERARKQLDRAARLTPNDPRLAVVAPDTADLDDLAEAGLWLYNGRAMRLALEVLHTYAQRGGRHPLAMQALMATVRWWGSEQPRYRITLQMRRELAAAGVSACPVSRRPDAVGCRDTMWNLATGPAAHAVEIRTHAAALDWHLQDGTTASDVRAWVLLAIRGYLAGEGAALATVRARLQLDAALAHGSKLGLARVLLLRAAGRHQEARDALDQALRDRDISQLDGGQRLLLAFEAVWQGHSQARALLTTARAAVVAEDRAHTGQHSRHPRLNGRAQQSLDRDLARIASLHARTNRAKGQSKPDARARPPLTSMAKELAHLAVAYLDDPALCERLARDYVDRAAYIGERGPMVASLYTALGDSARALQWWDLMTELQPRHTAHLWELSAAVMATGDAARARQHLLEVSAASGDAGEASLRAASWLLAHGYALDAVHFARQALSLLAPDLRRSALRLSISGLQQLGRDDEAEILHRQFLRIGPGDSVSTSDEIRSGQPQPAPVRDSDMVPSWVASDTRSPAAEREQTRDAVHRAWLWNPGHRQLQTKLLTDSSLHNSPDEVLWLTELFEDMAAAGTPTNAPWSPHAERARTAAGVLRLGLRARNPKQLRRTLVQLGE